MKNTLQAIWKLPPPEKRKPNPFPARWTIPAYRSDRDTDYLLAQLLRLVLLAAFGLFAAIYLDAHYAAGVLIDPQEFQQDKLLASRRFSYLIGPATFALSLLYYARIRLTIDVRSEDLPIGGRKEWTLEMHRRSWIRNSIIMLIVGLICIFTTHIFVLQITGHYEQQDSLLFMTLPQLFGVFAVGCGAIALPLGALALEKAIRFFPDLHANVKRNFEYTKKRNT